MLKDLNEQQRKLADFMTELSEEAFSAEWMKGLEFDLWNALHGKINEYGRLKFDGNILQKLKFLSNDANGWIYFHPIEEEKYISFEDWERLIAEIYN